MHLFEFGDLKKLPAFIRQMLHQVLGFSMSKPFNPYYDKVADLVHDFAIQNNIETIVELGAGSAPLTRRWLSKQGDYKIEVCDKFIHENAFLGINEKEEERLKINRNSIDILESQNWSENSLIVISASLHHIPKSLRLEAIQKHTKAQVFVFEPLSNNPLSYLMALLTFIPCLLFPFGKLSLSKRLQAILFCWLIPIIPLMLTWDALVSCVRQWPISKWDKLNFSKVSKKTNGIFQQILIA